MPLYNCGSVEIIKPAGVRSVSIDDVTQDGSTLQVSHTADVYFEGSGRVETVIEISDRDNMAGRGTLITTSTEESGEAVVSNTAYVDIEERPTASTGWLSDTLPAEVNLESTAGGVTKATTADIEIDPEGLERLQITNAKQDGSKVVVDFEVGGGGGFNIGEDDAENIGEVQVKNPVPWADGTESWIPGLSQSGAAQLLPDPTNTNLGAYESGLTLQGDTTTATIEIPLGLTPPKQFGSVESFVGVGVTTENGTQLTDTYDITIDPVAWIDDIEASCSLENGRIEQGESVNLDVTLTNNAGPAVFGSTVELDLRATVKINGEKGDDVAYATVLNRLGDEGDGVVFLDVRGDRGIGSDNDGDTVNTPFEIIPHEPGEYDVSVEYEIEDGTASRIIPTDELL